MSKACPFSQSLSLSLSLPQTSKVLVMFDSALLLLSRILEKRKHLNTWVVIDCFDNETETFSSAKQISQHPRKKANSLLRQRSFVWFYFLLFIFYLEHVRSQNDPRSNYW